jgi:predicted PurR-regulated permease PerM
MKTLKWLIVSLLVFIPALYMIMGYLDTVFFSVFLYYSLRPLQKRLKKHIKSHQLSVFATLFLVLIPFMLFFFYVLNIASTQLVTVTQIVETHLEPDLINIASENIDTIMSMSSSDIIEMLRTNVGVQNFGIMLLGVLGGIFDILIRVLLVGIFTYSLLYHGPSFSRWFMKNSIHNDRMVVEEFLEAVDKNLERVFYGNILTAIIVATVGIVFYTSLNHFFLSEVKIPYPGMTSILCGIASLIPGIGVSVIWIPAAIIFGIHLYFMGALSTEIPLLLAFIIGSLVFVDFIPSWLLRAKISGRGIDENLMLVAYILGSMAFGLMGIIIGPIILVLVYHYCAIILSKIKIF